MKWFQDYLLLKFSDLVLEFINPKIIDTKLEIKIVYPIFSGHMHSNIDNINDTSSWYW